MLPYITETQARKLFNELLKEEGSPSKPFNPVELIHTIITFDLGEPVADEENPGNYIITDMAQRVEKILFNQDLAFVGYCFPFRFTLNGREFVVFSYDMIEDYAVELGNFIYANDPSCEIHSMRDWVIRVEAELEEPRAILIPGEIDPEE